MSTELLNPIQVSQELNYFLSLDSVLLETKNENGIILDKFRFKGKPIGGERVSVYAAYMHREDSEDTPAILLLNDCGKTIDYDLMRYFFDMGYSVLMPDYSGETQYNRGEGNYTLYPERISYANFVNAQERMIPGEYSVTETCWFEWMSVANFSLEFLRTLCKGNIGLAGIRAGGEIVWKLMMNAGISCGITFNATGWLAYNGIQKFSGEKITLTDSQLKYMAGLDSQSYAPFVQAPILMLGTNRDKYFDIDRAYDTYLRVNKDYDKAICYSIENDGLLGLSAQKDIGLFFNKYLMKREVFVPNSPEISIVANAKGALEAHVVFDETSAVERSGICYAEDTINPLDREWIPIPSDKGQDGVFPLPVCEDCDRIFVFAYSVCSNGFTSTSRIVCYPILRDFDGMRAKESVLYSNGKNKQYFFNRRDINDGLCGYFVKENRIQNPEETSGYGDIPGLECKSEFYTYLVGTTLYSAKSNSILCFDLYSQNDTTVQIIFSKRMEDGIHEYEYETKLQGGKRWKKLFLRAGEFEDKDGFGVLSSFQGTIKLTFRTNRKAFLVNNIIWV